MHAPIGCYIDLIEMDTHLNSWIVSLEGRLTLLFMLVWSTRVPRGPHPARGQKNVWPALISNNVT